MGAATHRISSEATGATVEAPPPLNHVVGALLITSSEL